MDKLDIHEFLRIYLPGLYLAAIAARMLFGSAVDSPTTATAAIFVGLAFSWPAVGFAQRYFQHVANKATFDHSGEDLDYWATWIRLFEKRRGRSRGARSLEKKDVKRVSFSHYARRYGSPELYSFRIQKTFGVLYFSLALASVVLALLPISNMLINQPPRLYSIAGAPVWDAILLILLCGVFFRVSKNYFLSSLNMELFYWINPPDEASVD